MDEAALLVENEALVASVVHRICRSLPKHVDREDLMSAGRIGLLDAIRRYDPARGTALATMAWGRIRGAVLDELRGMDHLSLSQRRKEREVPGTNGVHANPPDSLQRIVATDGPAVIEQLSDPNATDPADSVHRGQVSQIIRQAVEKLPARDRRVIEACDLCGRPQQEVAAELGISASRVSQIRNAARRALAAMLGDDTLPTHMKPRRFFHTKAPATTPESVRAVSTNAGLARAAALSPERRSEISRIAAAKRWGKPAPTPTTIATTAAQMLEQVEREADSLEARASHLREAARHLRAIVEIESAV